MNTKIREKILHKELSYIIQGCCFEIRKEYGPGQKESVYVNLLKECLESKGIPVEKEKSIKIYSSKTGKIVGTYRPDLIVDNKIPVEVKSSRITTKQDEKQLYYYLRNSEYELGYLINFSTPRLFIKRIVYSNYKKPFLKILSCIFVFCFAWFSVAKAATLYLEPSTAEYGVGETFIQEARINLDPGENINVVEAKLKYPPDLLKVVDISFGNSILSIIPQEPIIDEGSGTIFFVGGILGGYAGKVFGDPDESNLLAKIIFKIKGIATNFGQIEFLETSQALLNDGAGTPATLTVKGASIRVKSPEEVGSSKIDEWQTELDKDKIPPEPFMIEIKKDPLTFEGKYFLVFSTTDKQTGINYYEISETKDGDEENWQKGESPYLLTDQSLKSFIKVKAIDKAGNERTEVKAPTKKIISWWTLIILIIIGIVIWRIIHKDKSKNTARI